MLGREMNRHADERAHHQHTAYRTDSEYGYVSHTENRRLSCGYDEQHQARAPGQSVNHSYYYWSWAETKTMMRSRFTLTTRVMNVRVEVRVAAVLVGMQMELSSLPQLVQSVSPESDQH